MDNKVNILIAVGTLHAGGTEKHVYQLITGLDRRRFDIHLWLLEGDITCNFGDNKIPADVHIMYVPRDFKNSVLFLNKYIKENKITIAYTTCIETGTPITVLRFLFFNFKLKHIVSRRGLYPHHSLKWKIVLYFVYAFANKIIANSKVMALNHVPFFKKKRTLVIYNPIEEYLPSLKSKVDLLEELTGKYGVWDKDNIIIGSLGRLGFEKGMDIIITAFSKIVFEFPNARLIIVGEGEQRPFLEKLVTDFSLSEKITFTGNITNGGYYTSVMDIFVLPSRLESFPNAILEAMINHCACIASNVGGVPEIIEHNKNGLLFNAEDLETLSMQLILLLRDSSRRLELSENAYRVIKQGSYSIEKNISEFQNVFLN